MDNHRNLLERSTSLLDNAQFLTLATRGAEEPWAATVNFVPLRSPLRLLWYSLRSARHSRHIAKNPGVAASIFMTGLPGLGLDGAQLAGTCESVENRVADHHHTYWAAKAAKAARATTVDARRYSTRTCCCSPSH